MAEKRKAGSASKEALAADKQKAQSARFIEAARESGVDETGREFEKALNKLTRTKVEK